MRKLKKVCPFCGSHNAAEYLYGMPVMSEELQKDLEDNKVILGGCCISDEEPVYHCNECDKDFGKRR